MSTQQNKIGSGFGPRSTAAEVLDGVDLNGRTALVTGGYSGIGLATTRALVNAGARVIVPARRPEIARKALPEVEVEHLDLADLTSVADFAERFLATRRNLDILINSAGIMAPPLQRVGPGWESQFATNHLGHFALVNRLWPALREATDARVVSVSSLGHRFGTIRWDDLHFDAADYDKWAAYGQAKTANVLFAVHLNALAADQGVEAFAVHPGTIDTHLQRHLPQEEMVAKGWMKPDGSYTDADAMKSPEQGAATALWAATSPQLRGHGGVYLEDVDIAEITPESALFDGSVPGVAAHAVDLRAAERLWALSAELTGVNAFEKP
ncbi:SDR family NAD(P)-dependent oxidoreductase [Kineosporia babensis]|uniref:Probable oxidoreductase n=1 Tax=Kineosporia babensis TaxID=499548 RepID=A0A9X1NM12_9ACTN|nr:SDR family NAD(P)-dependent oxidoreductase [Kineosporia babensis]MCD5316039.1 SDR family NAD(P)-dependent oxidoreductase [Kineosporia babensis]